MLPRKRTTLLVTIEQDPIPGWGNTPQDHEKWLRQTLESMIGHYHPTVELFSKHTHGDGAYCMVCAACDHSQKDNCADCGEEELETQPNVS